MEFETYETSSAQKRIYLIHQLHSNSIIYNMSFARIIEGNLVYEHMEKALEKLVHRHETLRTAFTMKEGEILQKVYDSIPVRLKYIEGSQTSIDEIIQNFIKPIDVHEVPLWKAELVRLGSNKHLFLFDIHHIIADGLSINIISNEIISFYRATELPPLEYQYVDFSLWQNDMLGKKELKSQEEYWLKQFEGEIPALNLPTDFPRSSGLSYKGDTVEFMIAAELLEKLNVLARNRKMTLYMVLLAIYNILLSRYTGQEDIVIGTPVAGRSHPELEKIVGMFINTLAVRNTLVSGKTFNDFLDDVAENSFLAFENQDYPFEMLVERLNPKRELNRNPLFDVMFALQNFSRITQTQDYQQGKDYQPGKDEENLRFFPYPIKEIVAKFDLALFAHEESRGVRFNLEYRTSLFRKSTIEQIAKHFCNILQFALEKPDLKLDEIPILTKEEREFILFSLNDTGEEYAGEQVVNRFFEEQVDKTPDKTALVHENEQLTYRSLNETANQFASSLRSRGVRQNTVVGILTKSSLQRIIGIFGIVKAGGAYLPLDPRYPSSRIISILDICQIFVLFSDTDNPDFYTDGIEIVKLDSFFKKATDYPVRNLNNINQPGDLLYIISTSGSTGRPKNVMINHSNFINLLHFEFLTTNIDFSNSRVLQFASIGFDVSAQEIFSTLLAGGELHLIDDRKKFDISLLFDFIERNLLDILFLPPAFLKLVFSEEEYANGFPTAVKHIISAGEQLIIQDRFRRYLKENQAYLHNQYGPAETHVVCTLTIDPAGEISEIPPIGKPVSNTKIFILNKAKHLQPPGVPGELYISGANVGRGYCNEVTLTKERFVTNSISEGELMYRTGDLARWLFDGNIEFLGRIDHQVKIRGFRIEVGEIENQLVKSGGIKEAVVVERVDSSGDKYLCAYIVSEEEYNISGLRDILSRSLPDYMIPAYFVQLKKIPLTTNGKIDLKSFPVPEAVKKGGDYVPPGDEAEEKMVRIWAEILEIDHDAISVDDNFFELGGHSLKAAKLAANIHKVFNIKVPLDKIFTTQDIRGLTEYIKGEKKETFISIEPEEEKEYYELSSAQKRLFILNEIGNVMTTYNLPGVLQVEGRLDTQRFERVFEILIKRQESLRTSFVLVNREPVQIICKEVDFKITYFAVAEADPEFETKIESLIEQFIKPFDLRKAPLLRVGLVRLSREKHILMFDVHHIIADGVSVKILIQEFVNVYEEKALTPIKIRYKDFSRWQNSLFEAGRMKELEDFWLATFSGHIPVLNMLTDYPRPSIQVFEGDKIRFEISQELSEGIKEIVTNAKTTLYIGLLAVFNILLSKYSEQEDIIVGIPTAGRNHVELKDVIGLFVNTVALRSKPVGGQSFAEFLYDVAQNALNAYENQDYPLEELINKLNLSKDFSRNPLFDVLFVSENLDVPTLSVKGLTFSPYQSKNKTTHLDLALYVIEARDTVKMVMEYSTALFKRSTIEKMTRRYIDILRQVVGNKEILLKDIEVSIDMIEARSDSSYEDYVGFRF